ncbi:MAG: hypothetical protein RIQ89_1610 [Bacteroidota bacterium]
MAVYGREGLTELLVLTKYQTINQRFFLLFFSVISLMIINWWLEIIKWKLVIDPLQPISYKRAVAGVLVGIAISFFTPNRVGEYLGRVLFISSGNRWKAALLTVIENFSQLVVTLLLGGLSCIYWLLKYSQLNIYMVWLSIAFILIVALLAIVVFFKPGIIQGFLTTLFGFTKFNHHLEALNTIHKHILSKILFLAVFRFAVFNFQFYLIAKLLSPEVLWLDTILLCAASFYIISFIPTILLIEAGVRGAVVIHLFSSITNNTGIYFLAILLLWVINLVLPALVGSLALLNLKFKDLTNISK